MFWGLGLRALYFEVQGFICIGLRVFRAWDMGFGVCTGYAT